jgi:hypothetical protein
MKIIKWFIKTNKGIEIAQLSDIIAMTSSNRELKISETINGKEIHKIIEFIK